MEERTAHGSPELSVSLLGVVVALSDVMDLVSPRLVEHHKRVAFTAYQLATALGMPEDDRLDILVAGLLHDSGALSLKQRIDFLEFELYHPGTHSEVGYRLLEGFSPLIRPAILVRYHHTRWDGGAGSVSHGNEVPIGSHILHLADRVAVMSGGFPSILARSQAIVERIVGQSDRMFVPELVEAFKEMSSPYAFWLAMTSPWLGRALEQASGDLRWRLEESDLLELGKLFARLIDFRTRWTAAHSAGVAATASSLGRAVGLDSDTCAMLTFAGYVHDIGKITVPIEILEKPQHYSADDFALMVPHPYYTDAILRKVPQWDEARRWAACHHERLDGSGYPFCLKAAELSTEARIIAVSDVFTALSEDRPLRKGMSRNSRIRILEEMAAKGLLDGDLVSALIRTFDNVDGTRAETQARAVEAYSSVVSVGQTRR